MGRRRVETSDECDSLQRDLEEVEGTKEGACNAVVALDTTPPVVGAEVATLPDGPKASSKLFGINHIMKNTFYFSVLVEFVEGKFSNYRRVHIVILVYKVTYSLALFKPACSFLKLLFF